jgi:NADP oxidoreductase coenzyme F420-dependent
MKFGTIGAGTVALAFAREALATGHEVVLSSRRGPESLAGKVAELGHGASAATIEAAASLDYALLAGNWLARYPEFRKAMQDGRDVADADVAHALLRKAKGFTHKDVKILQLGAGPSRSNTTATSCPTPRPPCSGCATAAASNGASGSSTSTPRESKG